MPALDDIFFYGLESREVDERIPFQAALKADDCTLDTDAIVGRIGYTSAISGALAGSGTPQHEGRFRPDINSARTVVVVAGQVFVVTDPTTPTAGDGVKTSLGTPFGATDIISGAALNSSYYLSTDSATLPWVRINWTSPDTYTLETLSAIPQGAQPSASVVSSLTWTVFNTITPTVSGCVVQDNSKAGFTQMNSAWRGFSATDNGNDDPVTGSYAQYKLAAAVDATGDDWVAVAVSPHDSGGIGVQYEVDVQVAVDVAGSPGTFYTVGHIYDIPPAADSPNLVFCDLRTLLASTRSAIRWIKFLLVGSAGGKFITYGYMFLPATPVANPGHFFVDFENVSTGEFSTLTQELDVTIPQAIVASYPDSRMGNNIAHSSGGQDDPFSASNQYVFNPGGSGGPTLQQVGGVITITGTAPTFSTPATLLARLWEDTDNGRRLVSSQTVTTGQAYTFVVAGGDSILANQLYIAGGVPPRASTITAHDQRLVAMYQNRVYISSFVPTSDTSNPFPQWPDIAIEDADGWSFDVFPNRKEQGQIVLGASDALYIITNETWYFMSDLTPNSPVFVVFKRGGLGHQGGGYFEDRAFVASWDGVYEGVGRANPIEMSEGIRRIYQDWLAPDSNVCIGYDPDTRSLYVFQDYRYIRYRFPLQGQPGKWTRGTLANRVRFAANWMDLVNNVPSTFFTDAWAGATQLQTLQTRSGWNKHSASANDLFFVQNYPPTGETGPGGALGSGIELYYRSETPASADYSVIAGVYNPLTSGGVVYGPAARMSTTLDTFYAFVLTPGGVCNLIKHVAGVETILGTYTVPGWTPGLDLPGDGTLNWINLKIEVVGTAIRGYIQGPGRAPSVPPSGAYVLRVSAVDTAITAVGKAGVYTLNGDSTMYYSGVSGEQSGSTATITKVPILALLTDDRYLAFLGGATDLGTAIPDWVYSTGFDLTPAPAVVKGILLDPTDTVGCTISKTVAASGDQEARSQDISPVAHQDEVWEPGFGDLRGQKFRVEFGAANDVTLRRAMWSRELVDEAHGG